MRPSCSPTPRSTGANSARGDLPVTVIAGITDGTTTWIGADSCAADSGGLNWPTNDKLLRVRCGSEVALLGFAGNGRLKCVMRDLLVLSDAPSARGDLDAWARGTVRRINALALDQRPPVVDPEDPASGFDGVALLGFRGGLWRLACDTAIPVPRSGAVGSGGDIAHGAMRALDQVTDGLSDRAIVELAMHVACAEQTDCGLPMDLESTR